MSGLVGPKIKKLAKILFIIGIVISVISAIVMFALEYKEIGFACLLGGPLVSFMPFILLYGFGQLVEDNEVQTKYLKLIVEHEGCLSDLSATGKALKAEASQSKDVKEWFCPDCGKKISKSPCIYCDNKGSSTEAPQVKAVDRKKLIPVKPIVEENGLFVCPVCKSRQQKNRTTCFSCGQTFINNQPNIPYWCAGCGKRGPFEGNCPDCGSSERLINE